MRPSPSRRKVANGTLAPRADAPAKHFAEPRLGPLPPRRRVSAARWPHRAITFFSSGWYTSGEAIDSPEQLDVALDKETYKAGDDGQAAHRLQAWRQGSHLRARPGLHLIKEVDVAKGGGEIEIPVGGDWGPGAYVTAISIVPMDEGSQAHARTAPSASSGSRSINRRANSKVSLDAAGKGQVGNASCRCR